MYDEKFMKYALLCAKKAVRYGEVPVGAVLVKDGKIVSSGYNKRETKKNALMHAEIIAINRACKKLGGWRLSGCELYITLEPCPMCAGAIINSRIDTVYIGTSDSKSGAFGSVCDLSIMPFNHKPKILYGFLQDECSDILREFFQKLRLKNR